MNGEETIGSLPPAGKGQEPRCAWCDKRRREVVSMVACGWYRPVICNECISLAVEILKAQSTGAAPPVRTTQAEVTEDAKGKP